VLTTSFSFVASANCLLYERVIPRFVDIEEDSLGLDPALLTTSIVTRATKGVLPVHVFGRPCRIEEIAEFSRGRHLALIEDACEGLGSSVNGKQLGSFGEISAFAFYPNKQITTGEGGMAVTDDPRLDAMMRSLRNQGRDADGTWLRHVELGYNYRLDEMSAALGVAQIQRLAELRTGRERVVRCYERVLGSMDWLTLPRVGAAETVDWFVYVVRLASEIDRAKIIANLAAVGIPSRPYFSPIHLQPYYRRTFGYAPGSLPVTERIAERTLALPFSSVLADRDVEMVGASLREAVHEQGLI
jgi:perosamine synthetase